LRALAVTSAKRSAALPQLPTVAEAGVKGYRRTTWYGLLAPAATSPALVTRISEEIRKAVNSDDVKKRILSDGAEPEGSSPKEFREFLAAEMKTAHDIVQKAGLKPR
jgi:tripartite-type tricarboxylate transporter receptor subunit TctC